MQSEKLDLNLRLVVMATQIHSWLAWCFIIIMNSLGWRSSRITYQDHVCTLVDKTCCMKPAHRPTDRSTVLRVRLTLFWL